MSKEKPSGEAVAHFIMAKGQAARVQSYLSRGRPYEGLTDTELAEKHVEGMREWASDPTDPARRLLSDDVGAEYDLRGSEPPDGVTIAELGVIVAAAEAAYEQMSDERKAEINAEMEDEYADAKKGQH